MDAKAWAEHIAQNLFEKDSRRLTRQCDELIETNHRAGGHPHGFLFGGQFHTNLPLSQQHAAEKKLLDVSLHSAGRAYMDDVTRTQREQLRVRQGIFAALQGCKTRQDVRDALPEAVVNVFSDLKSLPRTREEGWPFVGKPLQAHSYKQTSELLTFYVCNQLLF